MKRLLLPLCLIFASVINVMAQQQEGPYTTIDVNGVEREMLIHIPEGMPENAPLLMSLHGNNNHAYGNMEYTHFNEIADTAKFAVVYPNAIDHAWNVTSEIDREIAFLNAVIDYMVENYHVDANRVYLAGQSWGGVVVCRAMNYMYNRVAAFAACAAHTYTLVFPTARRAIPIVRVNGTEDFVMDYNVAIKETELWARHNGLSTEPEIIAPYPTYSKKASLARYTGRKDGIEVWMYTVEGGSHPWYHDAETMYEGIEVWNFCKQYDLKGKISTGIENHNAPHADNGRTYNLQGMQLKDGSQKKGIVIKNINGKNVKMNLN